MRKHLLVLSSVLLAVSLTGCKQAEVSSSEEPSSSQSQSGENYYLTGVNQNANYAKYLSNIAIDSSRDDGFKVRDVSFKVGDDNEFHFKPTLTVINDDMDVVDPSNWKNAFEINVEVKTGGTSYSEADAQLYTIVDPLECVIQFKSGAVGKNFRLTVIPTAISEAKKADFTQTLEFQVIDGYNVYDAKELAYFDTRNTGVLLEITDWRPFKEANGLDVNLKPNNLILQHDVVITMDDMPDTLLYKKGEVEDRYVGTFKDGVGIYALQEDREVGLIGNYFQFDYSQVTLIEYAKPNEHVNSHSSVFGIEMGSFYIENVNVTGNGKYATEEGEDKYAGSLMLVKAREYATSVATSNIIARQAFITFLSEAVSTDKGYIDFVIDDSKLSNNYNSFLYNWGGIMVANNTDFIKCGGPIVIQDHTGVSNDEYESADYLTIYGRSPKTTFNNCKLENYVAGQEAWFVQFGANDLAPSIKLMSDFYYPLGLSFAVDSKNHQAMLASSATPENPSVFNFVGFNKSGSAEAMVNAQVCGEIVINNGESDYSRFNYSQPTQDDMLAFATMQIFIGQAQAAQEAYAGGDGGAAFMELINYWGLTPASMSPDDILAAVQAKVAELQVPAMPAINHATLRTANGLGAPIFETMGGFGYFDGSHNYMQPLYNAVSGSSDAMAENDPFVTGATSFTALYYNGMMLVMGLVPVQA